MPINSKSAIIVALFHVAVYSLQHLQFKSLRDMPKCELDPDLQERVRLYMKDNGLTPSGAASKLEVDRTTFWRFCKSGRARGDTRALYRNALEKRINNANKFVADYAIKGIIPITDARTSLNGKLADHELKLIRRACESVLMLLDAYQSQSAGENI